MASARRPAASDRRRLADGLGRRRLADAASTRSARCRLPDGQRHLVDGVCQTTLADGVCQMRRLENGVWQLALAYSVWQTALADGVWQTALADGVCQTASDRRPWQMASGRHGTCQTASGRHRLADGLGRWPRQTASAVCQIACHTCQTVSGRRSWQTASGRRCLADAASGRQRLPDTVWQTALADGVCQMPSGRRHGRERLVDGVWRTVTAICQTACHTYLPDGICQTALADAASARPARWHLPDAVCQTAFADGVWQTWRLVHGFRFFKLFLTVGKELKKVDEKDYLPTCSGAPDHEDGVSDVPELLQLDYLQNEAVLRLQSKVNN